VPWLMKQSLTCPLCKQIGNSVKMMLFTVCIDLIYASFFFIVQCESMTSGGYSMGPLFVNLEFVNVALYLCTKWQSSPHIK
jgi:hypothetical protein